MQNQYEPKKVDEDFHIKNFILHYKKYIDLSLVKSDEKKFYSILDKTREEILKIEDIEKNTLFICDSNISRYVFLSAFSRLPRLVTNRQMNLMNIVDIWNKNDDWRNERLENDEVFFSEQDIREDVLCLYIDKVMLTDARTGGIANTVLSTRSDKVNKRFERLITWVFFRGTEDELKNHQHLSSMYELFMSDKDHYQIVNLNKLKNITDGIPESSKSLKDIY